MLDTTFSGVPTSVICHPTRGIFVAGYNGGRRGYQWVVRRSLNGGAAWSTVDTLDSGNAGASGMGADASGNIYVVGLTTRVDGSSRKWVVRKGTGGSRWATVDSVAGLGSPTGFAADSHGNLFVVGIGGNSLGPVWLVRENPGGTGAWQTVDAFQAPPGNFFEATAVAADKSGHVFVAGWAYEDPIPASAVAHWIVRRN